MTKRATRPGDDPNHDLAFTGPGRRAVVLTHDQFRTLAHAGRLGGWNRAAADAGLDAKTAPKWAAAVRKGLDLMSTEADAPAPQVGRTESVDLAQFRSRSGPDAVLARLGGPVFTKAAAGLLATADAGPVVCTPTPAARPDQ